MKNLFTLFLVFLLSMITLQVCAQNFTVRGRVIDATSFEPVGFANVYFKNSTIGTITDFEGYYEIKSQDVFDSLVVSFVGYQATVRPLENITEQVINFSLTPSMYNLAEVIILPGENPAIAFMSNVFRNKHSYNIDQLQSYQYNNYTKSQIYLRRLLNRSAAKDPDANGIFNTFSIVAEENSMPAIPAYMSETFSEVYYLKSPEREKTIVTAVNTNSLAEIETGLLTQLTQKSTKYNFYDNNVKILDKNFISPLSNSGHFYYKYFFTDSMYIDGIYCYELLILPKRKEDLVFTGRIWIADSTYALRRISVETLKEANLNFVQRIKIQQDYEPDSSGVWYPKSTRILADAINIFISASIFNNYFIANRKHRISFYDTELIVADTAYNVSAETWKTLRNKEPDETDRLTSAYIDSLKQSGRIRILTALVNMSVKGYVNLGKVELGPYLLVYKHNDVEGHRFRMGYRTNSALSTSWTSRGFLAYGTLDQKFKYNVQLERFLSRKSWTKAGIQYSEDTENLGAIDEFTSNSSFLSFTSSFGGADKLNSISVGRLWFETDVFRGFTQKVVFKNKRILPLSPDYFFAYYSDDAKTIKSSEITISEITFTSIYQPKATFIIDKNERFPVAIKKAPVFTLNYTVGLRDVLNSDFNYHMASLRVKHSLHFGGLGSFQYEINLAKCFTPLPYPLLIMFPANESFFRFDRTFNLMNYGEFIADESAELFVTYRQEGFILDKLPLIKKLKLRSVATASVAYGAFDESKSGFYDISHNPEGILPLTDSEGNAITGFKSLDPKKPYIEISYGIENILSVFRIDAIHRLSYLQPDSEGNKPKKFGIKIGAAFRF